MKIVAVAACPYGIVYTYLSAAALEKSAARLGIEMKVETQGSQGIDNELTGQDIASADLVLFALGAEEVQGKERFDAKTIVTVPIRDVIQKTDVVFSQIVTQNIKVEK